MASMRLLNQDYEYLYFDDRQEEKFVREKYPQHLKLHESFRYRIQKFDFFRYLAIHFYGGFYFDLDVLLTSGLSSLLELGCVFTFEAISLSHHLRNTLGMDWQIGNYAFGATRQHPFLEAIIESCVRGQRDPHWVKQMMRGTPTDLQRCVPCAQLHGARPSFEDLRRKPGSRENGYRSLSSRCV
jgi:mannosyltransferase OCH1-like enzyme